MKIIEKKCPNCGANLDFEVGERNVSCGSCRRKFAIMYDHNEDIDHLKAGDFTLKANRKAIIAITIFTIIFVALGITAAVLNTINFKKDEQRRQEEYEQSVKEMEEEQKQRAQEMRDEYNRNVEESEREYNERIKQMTNN